MLCTMRGSAEYYLSILRGAQTQCVELVQVRLIFFTFKKMLSTHFCTVSQAKVCKCSLCLLGTTCQNSVPLGEHTYKTCE